MIHARRYKWIVKDKDGVETPQYHARCGVKSADMNDIVKEINSVTCQACLDLGE